MRDLTTDPLNYQDVRTALDNAEDSAMNRADDDGSLCLAYLKSFIDRHDIRQQLTAYIDKEQPKPERPGIEHLKNLELECLAHRANEASGKCKPHRISVWSSEYRGRSTRGSHVFDLNKGYGSSDVRLYVRDTSRGLRAELHEDCFALLPAEFPPKIGNNEDEPVSASMDWLKKIFSFWR